MFAVIKSGGRQYKVSVGQKLEVNRLAVEDGAQIELGEVLLISDADADHPMIGAPFVDNASILATVERHARGKKLIVFKYKPKKRYRHRRGHRQELTILTIDDIVREGKSLITGEAPRAKEERAVEPSAEVETTRSVKDEGKATSNPEKRARRHRTAHTVETESSTKTEE